MTPITEPQQDEDLLDMIFGSFAPPDPIVEEKPQKNMSRTHSSRKKKTSRRQVPVIHEEEPPNDLLDSVFSPMHKAITGEDEPDPVAYAKSREELIWEARYHKTFPDEKPKDQDQAERYDALDTMFETLEAGMCGANVDGVQADAAVVNALDADEEASRILSKPKSEWTSKDKKVLRAIVLKKLQQDYQKLGRKVEKLSKYAAISKRDTSRGGDFDDNMSISSDVSTFGNNVAAYDSYQELRHGMGSMLHHPHQETYPRQEPKYKRRDPEPKNLRHTTARHQMAEQRSGPSSERQRSQNQERRVVDEDLGYSSFFPFCCASSP